VTETKYGKYILRGPKKGETNPTFLRHIAQLDGSMIEGAFNFTLTYISPKQDHKVHGPHFHEYPEMIGFIGADLNNPFDLGGEVDIYIGEELEKHTFNQTTIVYFPPNLVHCPLVYKKIEKPFFFLISAPVGKTSETHRRDLVANSKISNLVYPTHENR